MKRRLHLHSLKTNLLAFLMLLFATATFAQNPIPFEIKNTSPYNDNELYVAIVGIVAGDRHVWIDMKNGQTKDMSPSYNTVAGPVYNGNKGPGQNGLYAACFTKLSDIPNKKINLPAIYGCRMFISVKSQLYFYFFGATGAQVGYTSPSHTDPSDPNKGIKYEIIELTYNNYGFWGNTTRVDSYQYPMGLELKSTNGSVQKTGELKTHNQIIADYNASMPTEFKACYDAATTTILFPTKTVAWADGTIGTMPNRGPYVDYMKPYIDQVWSKYANEDLIFNAGDAGVFRGRVVNDSLTLTCISGGFNGRVGIIERRPTTQEALEGKGVLDRRISDGTVDLVVQAQICAALTRHVINVTTPNVGQQNWSNPANYYKAGPCNYYASFWHRSDISVNSKSYGFAYDDVFDQSATLHTPTPASVLVLFGGYATSVPNNNPPAVSLTAPANNATYSAPASITISANASDSDGSVSKVDFYNGSTLLFSDNAAPYTYNWTNVTAGTYTLTARATDNAGAVTTSSAVTVVVRVSGVTGLNGNYYLQNRLSGLYMDVADGSTADNANIQQWSYLGTARQQFTITDLGGGVYKVISTLSGKSIDVVNGSVDNGANILQWPYWGGTNQQFLITSTGDGFYKLIATHSNKMVEVSGFSTVNGGNVQQWQDDGQLSGQWKFVPVTNVPNGTGDGLTANYFNGMNFETPVFSRKDATVSFDWGSGTPNAAVNIDGFSTRWTGQIQPRYSGEYTFYLNSDNGRRLWINGQLVIDKWIDDWNVEYSGKITLTANQKYDIKIEYFENYGGANIKFEWSSGSQTREVVPTSQLYSNPLPSVSITSPANNATFKAPASITINASASDNVSISKVEFYNGAAKLGEDVSSPYSFTWTNVAAGTYILKTIAYDNMNAVTVSGTITVVVNTTTTTNQAPSVSLTSPANNSSFNAPASISIAANASDADGTISKVDFYNGTTLLFSDNTSPYSYTWTGVTAGTYTLTARATDNSGAVTVSSSVSVKVNTVSTDQCAGLPQYTENGGYTAGSKVKNGTNRYECKEWPYSGWCNGASWAYAPGSGAYWADAWYDRGSCSARTGNTTTTDVITIAPNPATDYVTVNATELSSVSVYNSQGILVMTSTQATLDLTSLPSGIYIVKADTGTETITRTIVKK